MCPFGFGSKNIEASHLGWATARVAFAPTTNAKYMY
jgi:hypothetical protein